MATEITVGAIPFEDADINLLEGILPDVVNDENGTDVLDVRIGANRIEREYLNRITVNQKDDYYVHVDIDSVAYTLIYDIGTLREVDYFYVSAFQSPSGIYGICKFEIYASENRDDLFCESNRIAVVDNENQALSKGITEEDFGVSITAKRNCRYVALKQLSTNAKDGISRITTFGAFCKKFNICKRYIKDNYDNFCISVKSACGILSGNLAFLCDGIVFDDATALTLQKNAEVAFTYKYSKALSQLVIIGKSAGKITVVADKEYKDLVPQMISAENGRNVYTYNINAKTPVCGMTVIFNDVADIDQVVALSDVAEFCVNTDNVITKDFLGVGGNALPTHLFDCGRIEGYNEAYFEVEKRRLCVAKPSVVRVWFQVDWFVMDEDGYINRKYCFNSPKMQAVYKELDAYKKAGIEVELNYGWKVSCSAQEWFSFPDVFARRDSAPRDLQHFATSCSDCLRELIVNRGYDNIKYLTFYNESNGGYPAGWDFLCPKGYDLKAYWKEMFLTVDTQLKRDGLRDKIEYWIAETGSSSPGAVLQDAAGDWLNYFNKEVGDMYEYSTFHQYKANYCEGVENVLVAKRFAGNHPVCVTEFSVYDTFDKIAKGEYSFSRNNIAAALGYINGGATSMLFWILSASLVDEGFWNDTPFCTFWGSPVTKCKPTLDKVSLPFYQLSLITNYIPRHSKIVDITPLADGYHAVCAVTSDGNYTVAIECDKTLNDKKLRINFPENINKKFNKHEFTLDVKPDGNMIVPPVIAEFDVTDTLCDTLGCDYRFAVYTTMPPCKQVVLDKCYVCVHPGEQIQLNATVLDGNNEKVKWSMTDARATSGFAGTITEDGLYTADSEYYANYTSAYGMNAVYAAKAEIDSGEYAICIIEIRK